MIGRFATSKAGHDKHKLYVIVAEEGDCVYLCDGRLKPLSRPKKKKIKHVQLIGRKVDEVLFAKLIHHQNVMDEEIKYAIKHYDK